MFFKSLNTGVILNDLQTAHGVPTYKNDPKNNSDNYILVYLTSIYRILLGCIAVSSIITHTDTYNILYHLGIRKSR